MTRYEIEMLAIKKRSAKRSRMLARELLQSREAGNLLRYLKIGKAE